MAAHKLQLLCLSVCALITVLAAKPPPGYVRKPDTDEHPPKYEFGYSIEDGKGGRQGHQETRDGEYARGAYYVDLPDGNTQQVQYYADDWGYHPVVSYSTVSKHGHIRSQFALGEMAVAALKNGVAPGTIGVKKPVTAAPTAPEPVTATPSQHPTITGVQPPFSIIKIQNGGSNVGAASSIPATLTADALPYKQNIGVSASKGYESSSSLQQIVTTAQGSSVLYTPSISTVEQSSSENNIDQQSYGNKIAISSNPNLANSGINSVYLGTSAYNGVNSQSNGDSGLQSAHKISLSSTVAPALSSTVANHPQLLYQNSGYTSDYDIRATVAPTIAKYEHTDSNLESKSNFKQLSGIISPTESPLVIEEHGSLGTDSGNVIQQAAPFIASTQSPILIANPQVSYQQNYASSGYESSYNEASNTVSSTVSPVIIEKQKSENIASSHLNDINLSRTPSSLLVQHAGDAYQQIYGVRNSQNLHGNIISLPSASASSLIYNQPQTLNKQNIKVATSLHSENQNSITLQEPTLNLGTVQSLIPYQESYNNNNNNADTSNLHNQAGISLSIVSHQPQVSYKESYETTGSSNLLQQASESLVSTTPSPLRIHQPRVVYQESYSTSGAINGALTLYMPAASNTISQKSKLPSQENYKSLAEGSTHISTSNINPSSPADVPADAASGEINNNVKITSYIADVNGAGAGAAVFGTKLKTDSLNINEIHKSEGNNNNNNNLAVSVTPSSSPRTSLRPIIVAEFDDTNLALVTSTSSPDILSESSSEHANLHASSSSAINGGISASSSANILSSIINEELASSSQVNVAPPPPCADHHAPDSGAQPIDNTVVITPRPEPLPIPAPLISHSSTNIPISAKLPRISHTSRRRVKNKSNSVPSSTTEHAILGENSLNTSPGVKDVLANEKSPTRTIVEVQKAIPLELTFDSINSQQFETENFPDSVNNQDCCSDLKEPHINSDSSDQHSGTQLLLDTLLQDRKNKYSEGIESVKSNTGGETTKEIIADTELPQGGRLIPSTSYNSNVHVLKQEPFDLENMQTLLHTLKIKNTNTLKASGQKSHDFNSREEAEIKKALEVALSQIESGDSRILVHTLAIDPDKLNSAGTHHNEALITANTERSVTHTPDRENAVSTSEESNSSNNDHLLTEQSGDNKSQYSLDTLNQNQFEQKKVNKLLKKPHIHTLLHSEIDNQSTNENLDDTSSKVNIENSVKHHDYDAEIAEAEKVIQSGYNDYFAEINRQIRYNQQLYNSIIPPKSQYDQALNKDTTHLGLIHQLLNSEKQQENHFNQQPSETGKHETATLVDSQLYNSAENNQIIDKPSTPVVQTKYVEVERPIIVTKPVTVERTKYVKVEKPVIAPQPVPVGVTQLVQVDRPVPYPAPVAVPHPVPVPYAVPHAIEVPIAHLVAVPQYVQVPVKEYHPVFLQNKPFLPQQTFAHNFPQAGNLHRAILKQAQHGVARYASNSVRRPQLSIPAPPQPHPFRLNPSQSSSRARSVPQTRQQHANLRKLCIEYGGFRPPLIPSKQIDEDPTSSTEMDNKNE